MDYKIKKHDWGMFVGGLALALLGVAVMFLPGLTLLSLATIAGIMFVFAGVAEIVGYFMYRKTGEVSGWQVAGGIINLIIGAVFLLNPVWTAIMLPWIAGFAVIIYGIFGIASGISARKIAPSMWGLLVASGIIGIICGIMFIVMPDSFVLFLGIFAIFRGFVMMWYGATTPKIVATQAA